MNRILTVLSLAAIAAVGCNKSPEGGGAKGTNDTFTFSAPTLSKSIKQGDRESVDLSLNRGSDFKKAVDFKADAPKGLSVKFAPATIKPSEPAKTSMTIEADKELALGDYTVKVTATPEAGTATTHDVKVTVDKK